jgi:hypothetical protein
MTEVQHEYHDNSCKSSDMAGQARVAICSKSCNVKQQL